MGDFLEILENANDNLLQDQERYFFYIKQQIENIITDYDITYTEIKDDRKTYPKFTKKQFILICQALQNRVYKPNKQLLKDDIYITRYNIYKVELCYKVFTMVCSYYNMLFNADLFIVYSGIERENLVNWLTSGKSRLWQKIIEDSNNFDNLSMLNSENSLLKVYYRNNQEIQRIEEGSQAILPDLSSPEKSITGGQNQIEQLSDTISSLENMEENT